MSAIAQHVAIILTGARTAVRLNMASPEAALNLAAEVAIEAGLDASLRRKEFRFETTSEQIESALFTASVARDILAGDVVRPSVGNVREYALSFLEK